MIVCYLDTETTGVDPYSDRIVEIALARGELGDPRDRLESFTSLVDPGIAIPAEATEIHGISTEDVAEAPHFGIIAPRVEELLDGAVLVGYNSRSFDVPLIDAELRRADRAGLPRDEHGTIEVREIDLFRVWKAIEPRTLSSATLRFTGDLHGNAHRADGDVSVLSEIIRGMADSGLVPPELEGGTPIVPEEMMIDLSMPADEVDRDGKFKRREDGKIVFAFGMHEGKRVAKHMDYVNWMLGKDFSEETKAWCLRFKQNLAAWSEYR